MIAKQAMGMGQDCGGDAAEDGRGSGGGRARGEGGGGEDDGAEGITLLYEEVVTWKYGRIRWPKENEQK